MKLLIVQFAPVSLCFLPLWTKCLPQFRILENNPSINLDNDQLDVHLLYFTIRPLQSSTCFVDRASLV